MKRVGRLSDGVGHSDQASGVEVDAVRPQRRGVGAVQIDHGRHVGERSTQDRRAHRGDHIRTRGAVARAGGDGAHHHLASGFGLVDVGLKAREHRGGVDIGEHIVRATEEHDNVPAQADVGIELRRVARDRRDQGLPLDAHTDDADAAAIVLPELEIGGVVSIFVVPDQQRIAAREDGGRGLVPGQPVAHQLTVLFRRAAAEDDHLMDRAEPRVDTIAVPEEGEGAAGDVRAAVEFQHATLAPATDLEGLDAVDVTGTRQGGALIKRARTRLPQRERSTEVCRACRAGDHLPHGCKHRRLVASCSHAVASDRRDRGEEVLATAQRTGTYHAARGAPVKRDTPASCVVPHIRAVARGHLLEVCASGRRVGPVASRRCIAGSGDAARACVVEPQLGDVAALVPGEQHPRGEAGRRRGPAAARQDREKGGAHQVPKCLPAMRTRTAPAVRATISLKAMKR